MVNSEQPKIILLKTLTHTFIPRCFIGFLTDIKAFFKYLEVAFHTFKCIHVGEGNDREAPLRAA